MNTFFSPAVYPSIEAMKAVSFLDAVSDSSIDGVDVFGFVDGVAYSCQYVYDEVSDANYCIAGEIII